MEKRLTKTKALGYPFAFFLCCEFLSCHAQSRQDDLSEPLQRLASEFPKMIHSGAKSQNFIEFCPDNTCQTFQSSRKTKLDAVADFAYLYLYFFSDYYLLSEWRRQPQAFELSMKILSKKDYTNCSAGQPGDRALCALRKLKESRKIKVFDVRSDEKHRYIRQRNMSMEHDLQLQQKGIG